jgi:hypothetical protein
MVHVQVVFHIWQEDVMVFFEVIDKEHKVKNSCNWAVCLRKTAHSNVYTQFVSIAYLTVPSSKFIFNP